MKEIKDLYFGFNDAENYKRPENKVLFDKYFYRTDEFLDIYKPSTNFIIGEKGTGKTAYATYITNNQSFNTNGFLNFIRETDYQKFYSAQVVLLMCAPNRGGELSFLTTDCLFEETHIEKVKNEETGQLEDKETSILYILGLTHYYL